ncbi:MAG: HAD hydrolase-like protein, partial [Chloroflexi bacterium]|nr:HAD hydrolase-like protein [Chloroflexota bacterium]
RASRIHPGEALCIGDEIRDIEAAHKVKIPFGAVSWGYTNVEALQAHAPFEVFANIEDMLTKIV